MHKKAVSTGDGAFMTQGSTGSLVAGKLLVLRPEQVIVLRMLGILGNAIDRANFYALRRIIVANALGALGRVNHVDLVALRNGTVRALRLANVAVDAFITDNQRHGVSFRNVVA
jgi:hypothetical protein